MIISASRRTDIPAFFGDWFMRRIQDGVVYVKNPMNPRQVAKIYLAPDDVDCIVFWTKNPKPFMDHLKTLDDRGYSYYFQFSLTPYDKTLEPGLPAKETLLDTFRELSSMTGKERVVWRYDPVIFGEGMGRDYHEQLFGEFARALAGFTDTCVISFVDIYASVKERMADLGLTSPDEDDMRLLSKSFNSICRSAGIRLQTCCERIDLAAEGIPHGRCVDNELIHSITGKNIAYGKDGAQRQFCGCVKSTDIGAYNTCRHGCVYCYASPRSAAVRSNALAYSPDSPILCGELEEDVAVFEKGRPRRGDQPEL